MPCPLPFPIREQIARRHQQGEPLTTIAADLKVPYRTARQWWRRFRDQGDEGLQTHYENCGPKGPKTAPAVYARAVELKREHPTWGAGLIRLQLLEQFPGEPLPKIRAIQRWFAAAGLQPRRAKAPPCERARAKEPHAVWQMDAKEQMRLADGSPTCVLTVTDEASGAVLRLAPFPPVAVDPCGALDGAADAALAL
jgi:transposase